MDRVFVIEAVLLAIYGQLLVPGRPVQYVVPYSSVLELYDLKDGEEPVMPDPGEDAFVRQRIGQLIEFFDDTLNRKKIEKALAVPWRKGSPIIMNEDVTLHVINAQDNMQYGESFDPVETELILCALREQQPIITDQVEFEERIIDFEVPVEVYDIDDFEFALENDGDLV